MIELESKIRKWGNSFGIILPSEAFKKMRLKEGETVRIMLIKKSNVLKETFGLLRKWKKPTAEIMQEVDKELWKNEH